MIDDLRALAIFAHTVKYKSFRGAATALTLSPSVVSYQISKLEQKLGVALLYRSTRQLSLTHEGEKLYQHAQHMLAAAQSGLDEINQNSEQLKGKLTISLPTALIRAPLTQRLAQFSQQHPLVSFNVQYKDERSNIISEGIDLAVRAGDMPNSDLKAKKIGAIKRLMVCSKAYYQSQPEPKKPESLSQWHWINLAMLPKSRTLHNDNAQTVQIDYQSHFSVNSVEAMAQLCIAGIGVATPPDYLANEGIKNGRLVHLFPQWQVTDIPLYATWPNNVPQFGLVKRLLAFFD